MMKGLVVTLSAFALIACGGSDTAKTGAAGDMDQGSEVSTPGPGETSMPGASAPEAVEEIDEVAVVEEADPQAATCLGLVSDGKLQDALPVCLAALGADPDNADLQAAVEEARAGTAKAAAAAAGAGADAEAAAATAEAAAGSAAGEATSGMKGMADDAASQKLGQ